MTLAEPLRGGISAPASTPRRGPARGVSAATQARIDSGLMRGRLPWPVVLYLVCVAVPVWFDIGPLSLSLTRVYLLLIIVPLFVRLLAGHFGPLIATDWLFLAHTAWIAVALGINSPDKMLTQVGSVGVEFLGGYAVARAHVRTPEVFLALCRALVLIVLCLFPFILIEAMTGRTLIVEAIRAIPGIRSVAMIDIGKRLGLERVQSIFNHPIHHGLFCSVVFSLAFVGLRGVVSDIWRWIVSTVVGIACLLGLSSGAWLALILQLGLIVWATAMARVRGRWWWLVALFALAYVMVDILSNRSPIQVFLSYATFSSHTAYWRMIIFDWGSANVIGSAEKGITGSPVFGIGLNDWIRPSYMRSGSMDNFWLVTAVRYGLPGLLTLAVGYFLVMARVMRRDFTADPVLAQIRLAWVFTFVGLTFTLCTVHVWNTIYSFIFFMFGAGVWLIFAEPARPDAVTGAGTDGRAEAGPARAGPRYSRFAPRAGRAAS